MKKLTLLLLLLALVLPGCAAPAASQPGTTQPQTQTAPQTTQPQEKDVWEWMKELAPEKENDQPRGYWHMTTFDFPLGTLFTEFIAARGLPHQLSITDRGLELTYSPICECEDALLVFTKNQEGEFVLTQTENLPAVRNDLTREDFEAFQVGETSYCEFLKKVGLEHDAIGGGSIHYVYQLKNGESVVVQGGTVLSSMTFYPPASQSSTNEK